MQPKQTKKPQKRPSLYSRFKLWCAYHSIPTLLLPVLGVLLIGVVAVIIGGSVLGWDIVGFIQSPTGYLIGLFAFLLAIVIGFRYLMKGR